MFIWSMGSGWNSGISAVRNTSTVVRCTSIQFSNTFPLMLTSIKTISVSIVRPFLAQFVTGSPLVTSKPAPMPWRPENGCLCWAFGISLKPESELHLDEVGLGLGFSRIIPSSFWAALLSMLMHVWISVKVSFRLWTSSTICSQEVTFFIPS